MKRTEKSIVNSTANVLTQVVTLIMKFVLRTFFIKYIGVDYLGLNGLFVNIIGIFSIAELGFGTAISTILYKPLADNDTAKVNNLVNLCRKIYTGIGIFIIVMSLCISPFMQYIIKDSIIDINQIRIYFMLFAALSSVSYFNFHKTTLLITDQKQYIERMVAAITNIAFSVANIIFIIVLKSFLVYLIVQIISTVVNNIIIAHIASKKYPYLSAKTAEKLSLDDNKRIKKNILALLFHKVGTIVVTSTDNLIISAMIGLTVLGLYSNYSLIIGSLIGISSIFLSGVSASVGELWVTEKKERVEEIFNNYRFIGFWINSFIAIGIFVMIEPFISLWLGSNFLLGMPLVIVLCLNMYITNMRNIVMTFSTPKGLYYHDRYKPIFESIINLVASILLAKYLGIIGVFLGTIISSITACVWVEGHILYKYGFGKTVWKFLLNYLLAFALFVGTAALTYFVCHFFEGGIVNFVVRLILCCAIPNAIYLLLFFKTKEFKYYVSLIKKIFKRKKKNEESIGNGG